VVPSLATGWSHQPGRNPLRVVPCSWQATSQDLDRARTRLPEDAGRVGPAQSPSVKLMTLRIDSSPELGQCEDNSNIESAYDRQGRDSGEPFCAMVRRRTCDLRWARNHRLWHAGGGATGSDRTTGTVRVGSPQGGSSVAAASPRSHNLEPRWRSAAASSGPHDPRRLAKRSATRAAPRADLASVAYITISILLAATA
jgi:hypothetical protein